MTEEEALLVEAVRRGLIDPSVAASPRAPAVMPKTGRPQQTLAAHGGQKGSFLPLSTDPEGGLQFDLSAGITGAIGDALSLPGDVVTGKLDVNSPEAMRRTTGLALLATGVPPGTRAAMRPATVQAPTARALKEAGEAGFEQARAMGVDYSSTAVKSVADNIQRSLEADGILAELSPKTFSILRKLQDPPEGSVASLEGIIAARRALQNAAGDVTNPTEKLAANRVIEALDAFTKAPSAAGVVAGPAAAAGQVLDEARGNYAAAKRSERITSDDLTRLGAAERAELNAKVANSGFNIGNQTRQRLRDILTRPKDARGYSQAELALIKQIADGKWGSELARYASNILGGGGGLGQLAAGAAGVGLTGDITGLGLPAAGMGLRGLYNHLVKRQVRNLDETIRQRSPLYEQMLKSAPVATMPPATRDAFLRSLLLTLGQPEPSQ